MNQKVHINCRRVYQSRPIFLKQSWIISDLIAEKVVSVPKKRFTECSPSALARLGNMPRKIILYGHTFKKLWTLAIYAFQLVVLHYTGKTSIEVICIVLVQSSNYFSERDMNIYF